MKTKIKSHGNEITDFYNNHTYLAVISLDSAVKKDDNYYPSSDNLRDFVSSNESREE